MLNSKEILEQTGISRATLNNYIGWGIVPKPQVLPPEPQDGDAPRLGYFPAEIVDRIREIQRLKKDGWSMARIAQHVGVAGAGTGSSLPPASVPPSAGAGVAPASASQDASVGSRFSGRAQPLSPASRRQQPVLADVAVLVAGLHGSTSLWHELPPEEYFELINDIWSAADLIFRRHSGIHGKHPADGMVGHFLEVPAGSFLFNALLAAQELREGMRRISMEWQMRKGWTTELYMNVGIDEGQEWLGPLNSASKVDFTALAGTINRAARIADFSRCGAIWASKNLLSKLSPQDRQRVQYGVRRRGSEGQQVFVPHVFCNVRRRDPQQEVLLTVAEIVAIAPGQAP